MKAWTFRRLAFSTRPGLACKMLGRPALPEACDRGTLFDQLSAMPVVPLVTTLWSLLLGGAVYLGAGIGVVWLFVRRSWRPLVLLLAVIGYFVAISFGGDAISRMRIPFFPYLAILFGVGVWAVVPAISPRWPAEDLRGVNPDSTPQR